MLLMNSIARCSASGSMIPASRMPRSELARRYNEFHALLVQTAKHFCLKREPHCESCPLRPLLPRRPR